jgi:hypothetical protein
VTLVRYFEGQRQFFIPHDIPPASELGATAGFSGPNGRGSKTVDGGNVVRGFESLPLRLSCREPSNIAADGVNRVRGRLV